ncbi:MAG: 2-C-methyl-D-erythritol 2,4-cyclodiphosphate synthase [Gemmatimonadaceae bacterium]
MSVRFTAPARRAIDLAIISAESFGQQSISSAHLLLGLLRAGNGRSAAALTLLGGDADVVAAAAERSARANERDNEQDGEKTGTGAADVSGGTAERILRAAADRARNSRRDEVSDTDMLRAAAMDSASIAGRLLAEQGITADGIDGLSDVAPTALPAIESQARPRAGRTHRAAAPDAAGSAGAAGAAANGRQSRAGIGYDSHRLVSGGPMTLGGVAIPGDLHLEGHSDGDAVAHAITDAILGAAGAGDIGEMFPDSHQGNRGRSSIDMLALAVARVRERGWIVVSVDATVIAERPAISPHRDAIRAALARPLGIPAESVSVKGKTNEGMGWLGRGEGIACMAIATLESEPSRRPSSERG